MTAVALTIAGSDCSGGAGLQADLKTFHQHGVYGQSVVTLITAQNTMRVDTVSMLEPSLVVRQIDAVIEDIPPAAAKTGALGSAAIIETVADAADRLDGPLIVDPVMISKHGHALIDDNAAEVLRTRLIPKASLLTPNMHEAAALSGRTVETIDDMQEAARSLADIGGANVLIKGGHLSGRAVDVLYTNGKIERLDAPRIDTRHTHGTGCVYSAAITAHLARGENMLNAVRQAKAFMSRAIAGRPGLGNGHGPIDMFAEIDS